MAEPNQAEEAERVKRESVISTLKRQPEGFRCNVSGRTLKRDELVAVVGKDPQGVGKAVVDLTYPLILNPDKVHLGKRLQCLVCETVTLSTKGGDGQLWCCDQQMAQIEPKQLPSSD